MKHLSPTVWLLMACQALAMCSAPVLVFVGGIIGSNLTMNKNLATLPVALMVVGTAAVVMFVPLLSQRLGRKAIFIGGALLAIVADLLAVYALQQQSFVGFCGASALLGASIAVVQQFRFAAMESVEPELMPSAAARVLLGGLFAAILGPELALRGQGLMATAFAGSFILLAVVHLLVLLLLLFYRNTRIAAHQQHGGGRSLRLIRQHPEFWLAILSGTAAYAVMSFIMTATPLSMHHSHGHSLADTKWVIQSHILAMFLPSLISGWLVRKFGTTRLIVMGCIAFLICIVIASMSHGLWYYWVSLVLLGIGWNFLFVSGTVLLPRVYQTGEAFKVQAVNEFSVFSVQAIAALSSGWVLQQLGWQVMLLICLPVIFGIFVLLGFSQNDGEGWE